ncbi:MAG TPA: hypothetical protein VKA64_07570 [Gammaproteobacteria bacterium]|nr:hypothetical protein [Gammaproteobacteria bacterium]
MHKRTILIAGSAVLALMAAPLVVDQMSAGQWQSGSTVYAAEDGSGGSGGHQYKGGRGGESGSGGTHGSEAAPRGGKGMNDVLRGSGEDTEEESDRPPWAGPNPTGENPHQQGGGQPGEAGTNKGDSYGDLWVVLRNPVTGVPILNEDGFVQPIDADGNVIPLDAEGAPLDESLVQEVDFGRLNIGRAPTKVFDHALTEALDKISSGTSLTLDPAGRIVVDGATIDSPLENLALYVALMTDDSRLDPVEDKLHALYDANNVTTLDLAASLLAAGADKTGTITVDTVAYLNTIYNIASMTGSDYPTSYTTFDYDRAATYDGTVTYYEQAADGTVTQVTKPILEAVFNNEPYTSADGAGITDFTQAVDDALQVIEFVHEQIHTE